MFTRSLIGLAVATIFMGTAAHAADPAFIFTNQTGVEQVDAVPVYKQIKSDASS